MTDLIKKSLIYVVIGINFITNCIILTIMLESFLNWFNSLEETYRVNPYIFATIYIGAIPFFSLSIAWLIRNYRKSKSIVFPALSAMFFFISAYLYLLLFGNNVPWWVYAIVILMVVYGAYSTLKSVRKKMEDADSEKEDLTSKEHEVIEKAV